MTPIVLIPARMAATRLPGKPLADICGLPMIVRVLRQAEAAGVGPVAVAAGDAEIVAAVEAAGGQAVLTDPDLPSGSDRIVAALSELDPQRRHDVVINLQGDIPFVRPDAISAVARLLAARPGCDISTVMVAEADPAERTNPDIPKVVAAMEGDGRSARALYFTRSVLYGDAPVWLHHGIYGFRREALEQFTAAQPSPLERRERLEQLRALELGMSIWAAVIDEAPISVDNPADLERARAYAPIDHRQGDLMTQGRIAFQGELGANSHEACMAAFPELEPVPHATFEDAFRAVKSGDCQLGMIPVENSTAGRVADVHHLLPASGLKIIGERFKPIHFQLMANPGVKLEDVKTAVSMAFGLAQCSKLIRQLKLKTEAVGDTAGAAKLLAQNPDPARAAISPALAAEIYGLNILARDVEDEHHNTTRFLVMTAEKTPAPPPFTAPCITSFVFRVRNLPAALYKAMGGFATNGVNISKLESYMENGAWTATFFYAEADGRPEDRGLALAFEELQFFSEKFEILEVYPADPFRTRG